MKWVKHQVVEQNLRTLGIKFEVETNIQFNLVDLEEGKRKQVRLKVNPDVQLRYAEKMLEDTAWNMCILQKERHGKRYWPWSGNQRLGAYDLVKDQLTNTIDAYVVEVHDPVMMDLLPRLVNTWEAVEGMSKDEAIANARFICEKHGITVQEAAKMFGLKPESVYKSARIEETKKKIETLAVSTNNFSDTTIEDLGRIENSNALKRAASILHKYNVKGNESKQLINEVRQGETEAQQIVTLEKWESILDLRKKPKQPKKDSVKLPHKELNRERLLQLITALARFCEQNRTVTQMQLTDPVHLTTVKKQWKIITPVMETVLKGE